MNKFLKIGMLTFTLMCSSSLVQAQSMNYAVMEEMYGEPVTTSANGSPQRQSEVALNMEIITAEEIERTGARSIPEVIRFLPGVSVRQLAFGQTEVSIRGYNQPYAERILVLLNGRQVYTDTYGQVIWDNIPVEMSEIKQIEVVKGPNTALFGPNAVSGVINIITYNPLHDDVNTATITVGNKFKEGSVVKTIKYGGKYAVKLAVGGYELDKEDEFSDVSAGVKDVNRTSVSLDAWVQLNDKVQAQLELSKNQSDRNEFLPLILPNSTEFDTTSIRGRIMADTKMGMIEADVYHNDTRGDYITTLGAQTALSQVNNRITVLKLNDTFEVGNDHIFRVGGEYRAGSNIYEPYDNTDLTSVVWSANALWDWKATDKLRTSAALRFDRFKLEPDGDNISTGLFEAQVTPYTKDDFYQLREEYSVNLGAVYQLSDFDTVRASYARGVDLPSFSEFGLQMAFPIPTANSVIGNPYTDTSIVTNYELGYDHKIKEINGKLRSAVFYQYNEEMQGIAASESGPIVLAGLPGPYAVYNGTSILRSVTGNLGDSEMMGIELGLEGKYLQNWDWDANYTYVKVNDMLNNGRSSTGYEYANVEHIVNAHLGYNVDKWHTDVFAQYKSAFDDKIRTATPNVYAMRRINSQVIVNANAAYDITDQLQWTVSGASITNKTQQTVYSDVERQFWTSFKFDF